MRKEDGNLPENKMRVRVQFFGSIRAAAAVPEEEILIKSDGTVRDVLETLRAEHAAAFQGEVFRAGELSLRDDLTLTVNGVIIDHGKVPGTPLHEDSVIALLPVFPGGG